MHPDQDAGMPSWAVAAPRFLDPVLALAERIDRRVRGLRPIREGGVLHLELRRHRGAPVALADGTVVRAGDRKGIIHFDNRRVRELASNGWQAAGFRQAREDFAELARWHAAQPPEERPAAYFGVTLLAPLARRLGFEVRPRPRSAWTAVEDWYLRSLLARWARTGRARVDPRLHRLGARQTWMSAAELLRRHARSA
jgi:YkoP domain